MKNKVVACFLNMQAFQRGVRRSRMHVTYWSNARQHACGRKARRHTIDLHVTQDALFAQQNNSIYSIHMLCSNIQRTVSGPSG
jgi:ribosomal protein L32